MKKSLLTFLVLLVAISSFGQSWMNTGNSLQRQTNGTYSNYRFNLGSPGFMYFYNKTQTDSLFNIAIGSGVTSFNTRTGAITLLSADVTTSLGFTPENAANKTNTVSNSTTQYTSAKAVQDYVTANSVQAYVYTAPLTGVNSFTNSSLSTATILSITRSTAKYTPVTTAPTGSQVRVNSGTFTFTDNFNTSYPETIVIVYKP